MRASALRKLAVLLCAVVPLIPLAALFAEPHDCACGMSKAACICALTAARAGAHCHLGGPRGCSVGPARDASGEVLFASLDLRGWLQVRSWQAGEILAPAGTLPLLDLRVPPSFSSSPEPPPPRIFRSA